MTLPGGATEVAAHAYAASLGLKDGQYSVDANAHGTRGEGGAFGVTIPAQHLPALCRPQAVAHADMDTPLEALKQDVAANNGQWQPGGFNNDDIHLRPHQELAIRAIAQQKHMMLSYAAGTGKTAILYGAASHLLETGKIDRALITMPKGPRGQQMRDYHDETDLDAQGQPKLKPAEKNNFLSPEMRDKVAVC